MRDKELYSVRGAAGDTFPSSPLFFFFFLFRFLFFFGLDREAAGPASLSESLSPDNGSRLSTGLFRSSLGSFVGNSGSSPAESLMVSEGHPGQSVMQRGIDATIPLFELGIPLLDCDKASRLNGFCPRRNLQSR